jgi:hypothetical protein
MTEHTPQAIFAGATSIAQEQLTPSLPAQQKKG